MLAANCSYFGAEAPPTGTVQLFPVHITKASAPTANLLLLVASLEDHSRLLLRPSEKEREESNDALARTTYGAEPGPRTTRNLSPL